MKTRFKIICFCLMWVIPLLGHAEVNLKKADKLYDNLLYEEAIPEYKKALKEDDANPKAISRLAHCYRLIKNKEEAERWYSACVKLKDAKPLDYYYYAESLINNGKYVEAEKWVMRYVELQGQDDRAINMLKLLTKIGKLIEDSANYKVQNLPINSKQSDFGAVIFNGGLVFSSARDRVNAKRKEGRSENPFYYLYFARGEGDNFKKPETFAPNVFTQFNNGPICFNKTFSELYVTRNNIEDNKVKAGSSGSVNLKIYKFKRTKQDWNGETPFPYNSDDYSCAHAFLSADGNKLFFSSDMPGGYGRADIWVCTKKGNKWGKPENLGPDINTAGSEGYPFLDDKDGLFFASNGHGGLGGFDILYSKRINNTYDTPINPGYPINSAKDDFGWIQDETGSLGYFTSNRAGREENDDIYSFKRMSALLNVRVYDADDKEAMAGSTVKVISGGEEVKELTTSKGGIVSIYMEPGKTYQLVVENENYVSEPITLDNNGPIASNFKEIPISKKDMKPIQDDGEDGDDDFADNNSSGNATASLNGKIDTQRKSNTAENVGNDSNAEDENSEGSNQQTSGVNQSNNKPTTVAKGSTTNKRGEIRVLEASEVDPDEIISALKNPNKKKNPIAEVNTKPDQNQAPKKTSSKAGDKEQIAMNEHKNKIDPAILNNMVGIKLKNIYYELGKPTINAAGIKELDVAIEVLKSNPGMKIELDAHTDCRETEYFNQKLSERRASTALDYLVAKGIRASQIIAIGFGETRLTNHCECEGKHVIPCSEKQHQANRRTEIRLLTAKNNQ